MASALLRASVSDNVAALYSTCVFLGVIPQGVRQRRTSLYCLGSRRPTLILIRFLDGNCLPGQAKVFEQIGGGRTFAA